MERKEKGSKVGGGVAGREEKGGDSVSGVGLKERRSGKGRMQSHGGGTLYRGTIGDRVVCP